MDMHSQKRGGTFWLWADCLLKAERHQAYSETGSNIDIQVRASREGCTQMFIGVYNAAGNVLCEEFYSNLSCDTLAQALDWGIRRCDVLVDRTTPFKAPHRIPLDRVLSTECYVMSPELETCPRESYLRASKKALAEYANAKAEVVASMRDRNVDITLKRKQAQRLNAALDVWASLPRLFLSNAGNESQKKAADWAPPSGSYLFVEKLEHDRLGIGFSGIKAS